MKLSNKVKKIVIQNFNLKSINYNVRQPKAVYITNNEKSKNI